MITYEAPAKINLSLHIHPPDSSGMHPLESLVQTVDLIDEVSVSESDSDVFICSGADLDPDDNLVMSALRELRARVDVPPVSLDLRKRIPLETGLGGGSSDAAATLAALLDLVGKNAETAVDIATELGADVPLFLRGGTQLMSGFGEVLQPQPALSGFAVAVVVPQFGLSTAEVYRRWDKMEGPMGPTMSDAALPPELRGGVPLRNDLLPPALDIEPGLGDFISDASSAWDTPVAMTGSGAACFAFFTSAGEAREAAAAIPETRGAFGLDLRRNGVARANDLE